MTIGDRVSYQDKKGIICRDRLNGMVDIMLDLNGEEPKNGLCGGVISCVYKHEAYLLENRQ